MRPTSGDGSVSICNASPMSDAHGSCAGSDSAMRSSNASAASRSRESIASNRRRGSRTRRNGAFAPYGSARNDTMRSSGSNAIASRSRRVFPTPGVTDDRQHRAAAFVTESIASRSRVEFVGAADECVDLQTLTAPRSDLRADLVHEHRRLLALERERSDGAYVEQRERLVEHGRVRIDRARSAPSR